MKLLSYLCPDLALANSSYNLLYNFISLRRSLSTASGVPIIVQGCILQFGDIPIDLSIQSVVVDQVASAAIEFSIITFLNF